MSRGRAWFRCVLPGLVLATTLGINFAHAQQPAGAAVAAGLAAGVATERTVSEWLARMHEASRGKAYIGTFVVTAGNAMSSSRIWHVCDGTQQMERVDSLTGAPRSTLRRNDHVVTFMADTRVARTERRASLGVFPGVLQSAETTISDYYSARAEGVDRVAGHEAEVVLLSPRDRLRFAYRIWAEKRTGLALKIQTLDADGRVLEQSAFSELQLDAPVRMDKLAQMMNKLDGWRVEKPDAVRTTAAAEGWTLKSEVPGFKPMSCYKRPAGAGGASAGGDSMQWVFSDGLASVSLFVEPFDRTRHQREHLMSLGSTHTLTRRIEPWWLTVVGEVPAATLRMFADGLERSR